MGELLDDSVRATRRGDLFAAHEAIAQVLALDPGDIRALASAVLWSHPGCDSLADRVRDAAVRLLRLPGETPWYSASRLFYACGRVHEREGNAPAAAHWYNTGGRLRAAMEPYNPDALAHVARNVVQWMPPGPLPETAPGPILVCGMPRTGSTILARALCAHPHLHGGGEYAVAEHYLRAAADARGVVTAPALRIAGRAYRAALPPGVGRPVDKSPSLVWQLGPLAYALPFHAVITRRDPVETLLSCWRQPFRQGIGWAYHPAQSVHYLRVEEQAETAWMGRLGERVCTLHAETFAATPEPILRALLAWIGEPWSDACLRPERAAGEVDTASLVQVRAPIRPAKLRAPFFSERADALRELLDAPIASVRERCELPS